MDNEAGVSLKWQCQRSCAFLRSYTWFIIFFNYSNPFIFWLLKKEVKWLGGSTCSRFLSRFFTFMWEKHTELSSSQVDVVYCLLWRGLSRHSWNHHTLNMDVIHQNLHQYANQLDSQCDKQLLYNHNIVPRNNYQSVPDFRPQVKNAASGWESINIWHHINITFSNKRTIQTTGWGCSEEFNLSDVFAKKRSLPMTNHFPRPC